VVVVTLVVVGVTLELNVTLGADKEGMLTPIGCVVAEGAEMLGGWRRSGRVLSSACAEKGKSSPAPIPRARETLINAVFCLLCTVSSLQTKNRIALDSILFRQPGIV
jgi:hypothetical protein